MKCYLQSSNAQYIEQFFSLNQSNARDFSLPLFRSIFKPISYILCMYALFYSVFISVISLISVTVQTDPRKFSMEMKKTTELRMKKGVFRYDVCFTKYRINIQAQDIAISSDLGLTGTHFYIFKQRSMTEIWFFPWVLKMQR